MVGWGVVLHRGREVGGGVELGGEWWVVVREGVGFLFRAVLSSLVCSYRAGRRCYHNKLGVIRTR